MPTRRIIIRHVLPNAIASLLSRYDDDGWGEHHYCGGVELLGVWSKATDPIMRAMLQQAQEFMRTAWWMAIYPGLCILVTVFGFNILGDSLRDVLDPRLK